MAVLRGGWLTLLLWAQAASGLEFLANIASGEASGGEIVDDLDTHMHKVGRSFTTCHQNLGACQPGHDAQPPVQSAKPIQQLCKSNGCSGAGGGGG